MKWRKEDLYDQSINQPDRSIKLKKLFNNLIKIFQNEKNLNFNI